MSRQEQIYRFFIQHGCLAQDAEDLTQQVCLRLCQAGFTPDDAPPACWRRTCHVVLLDYLRQQYRERELFVPLDALRDCPAPSAGVPVASFWLSTMNHDVSHVCTSQGWTKAMLLNDVYPCTVFYVNTHGYGIEGEHTAVAWIESDIGELIYHEEVGVVREQAVGSGIPPFNTGNSPISLAFADACLTGLNNGFAYALLTPFDNAYTHQWCENQAEVGWRIETLVDGTRAANTGFWSALASGCTAHQARDALVYDYLAATGQQLAPGQHPSDLVSVWGDYYARIWGVYTATDSFSPNFWYW